jgi:hypothetical protein
MVSLGIVLPPFSEKFRGCARVSEHSLRFIVDPDVDLAGAKVQTVEILGYATGADNFHTHALEEIHVRSPVETVVPVRD